MTDPNGTGKDDQDWGAEIAKLRADLNKLAEDVTTRINTLNTAFADLKKDLSTQVGQLSTDLGTVKAQTENNTASIAAFTHRLDDLHQQVTDATTEVTRLGQRLGALEDWVSRIDTAIINEIAEVKDFAAKQSASSVSHTDEVAKQIRDEITALRTSLETKIDQAGKTVAPHTHQVPSVPTGQPVPA